MVGDRLTDEEVSSIRAATDERDEELLNAAARRTSAGGSVGAYNNFWMDRGARTNRTSMVVDPPDGRLPALTPAGELRRATGEKAPGGMENDDTWEDRHIWERCVTRGGMPNEVDSWVLEPTGSPPASPTGPGKYVPSPEV